MPRSTDAAAGAHHDFGAWTFRDQIRALVTSYVSETMERHGVLSELGQQTARRLAPVIAILPKRVSLQAQTVDPHGIGSVTQLVLDIQRDEYRDALTYLRERPELLTQLTDLVRRRLVCAIAAALLDGSAIDPRVPAIRLALQRIQTPGPDGEALSLGVLEAVDDRISVPAGLEAGAAGQ